MADSIMVEDFRACAQPEPGYDVVRPFEDGAATSVSPLTERLLSVLVCDDQKDAAESLSIILNLWGHEVRVAHDGQAVLEMLSGYQPDVMLLDIAMPRMDGCRLAELLRRQPRFRDTLLIAITGYADQAHRSLCEEAGYDRTLIKPVELATLEHLLLVERAQLARSFPKAERRGKPLRRKANRAQMSRPLVPTS